MTEPNRRWFRVDVRAIRGVVSIACLLACIGFAALWVRSYYQYDSVGTDRGAQNWSLSSLSDRLCWVARRPGPSLARRLRAATPISWTTVPYDVFWGRIRLSKRFNVDVEHFIDWSPVKWYPDTVGIGYHPLGNGEIIVAPHWPFVIVFGALAVVLKPNPRLQFTVRDLLVAMTMVAVVVAAFAAIPRSY
jgi:hypothetical protein